MPVSDELLGAGVEVAGALVGEEKNGQGQEEHHVPSEDEEDHAAEALQELARAGFAHAFPFIVVAVAAAAGGTAVKWGFAADAGVFPLGVYRMSRKGGGHGLQASVMVRLHRHKDGCMGIGVSCFYCCGTLSLIRSISVPKSFW